MELSQQQVDAQFQALVHDLSPGLGDGPDAAALMVPRAWRWWRVTVTIPVLAVAVAATIAAVRMQDDTGLRWARTVVEPGQSAEQVLAAYAPALPFAVAAVVAVTAMAFSLSLVVGTLRYWAAGRGGMFTATPIDDPRAAQFAWLQARANDRRLVGAHQHAQERMQDPDTGYERRRLRLWERWQNAKAAGHARKAERLERRFVVLHAASAYTMTPAEMSKYAPAWHRERYPVPVDGGYVNSGRAGRGWLIAGAIVTLGLLLPIYALIKVGMAMTGSNR